MDSQPFDHEFGATRRNKVNGSSASRDRIPFPGRSPSLPSPSHPQPLWTASVGDDRAGRDSGRGEGRESSTVSGGDETLTTPHDVTFARFDRLSALERSSARKAEGDTTATLWLLHCWGWKPPLYQRSSVETVASSLIISRVRRVALL